MKTSLNILAAIVGVVIIIIALIPWTDEKGTVEILKSQGYTSIKTEGHGYFKCGEKDVFSTKFIATNPAGNRTKGTVCAGLLKNKTIRFD